MTERERLQAINDLAMARLANIPMDGDPNLIHDLVEISRISDVAIDVEWPGVRAPQGKREPGEKP